MEVPAVGGAVLLESLTACCAKAVVLPVIRPTKRYHVHEHDWPVK